ncbi:glutaredoxin family protein [Hydromonas duriensis]|uniref:Thioredoxin reductase (NADPH) n=1 Tax=Hydromonas duriensis TaxID=1527608 RepID=A0A4R6Y9Y4_9BURK|nr:glutaredoxin family protein [Hydromonas duriensis]TDR32305.1 thioredoxin reductase (NADPH) [Hydromonas duriensis]
MSAHFILYSRETCHLCHDMYEELRLWQTRINFTFDVMDIDEDVTLQQKYGMMVPALCNTAGEVLCYGRLNPDVLTLQINDPC